jgi:hypothetical protein
MFADGQGYNDIPVSHKALVRGEFIKNVIPAFGEKLLRVCYNWYQSFGVQDSNEGRVAVLKCAAVLTDTYVNTAWRLFLILWYDLQ